MFLNMYCACYVYFLNKLRLYTCLLSRISLDPTYNGNITMHVQMYNIYKEAVASNECRQAALNCFITV